MPEGKRLTRIAPIDWERSLKIPHVDKIDNPLKYDIIKRYCGHPTLSRMGSEIKTLERAGFFELKGTLTTPGQVNQAITRIMNQYFDVL